MSTIINPRVSLPTLSRGFSHSLVVSGLFGIRQKSSAARRKQYKAPLDKLAKSQRTSPKSPTHHKPRADKSESALHICPAANYYLHKDSHTSPQTEDSHEHAKRDEMSWRDRKQLSKEERHDETEQAPAQSGQRKAGNGGSHHQFIGGNFPNSGLGAGSQWPQQYQAQQYGGGAYDGNNGMTFQGSWQNNAFPWPTMGFMQPSNTFGTIQPDFFTSAMNMPTNMPTNMPMQPWNPNFFTPSLPALIQGMSLNRLPHNVQYNAPGPVPLAPLEANRAPTPRKKPAITAPSAASGGVPEPTDAYVMRASFMPRRRSTPGPLLVVIDLNGTLLHRLVRSNKFSSQRRHAEVFANYCVETFWVVIWSSAKPHNVNGMVSQLLSPDVHRQVVAVWARDKFGLSPGDYARRTQCYKRLTRLWDDPVIKSSFPRDRPGFENAAWDQGNTVLIDDSVEKARSEPHNAITLPEFKGEPEDPGNDVLPAIHDYLNELCYQEDVSAYMRAHPFKMAEKQVDLSSSDVRGAVALDAPL